jgi:hypothetical protein
MIHLHICMTVFSFCLLLGPCCSLCIAGLELINKQLKITTRLIIGILLDIVITFGIFLLVINN